jgi:hypothetical protein
LPFQLLTGSHTSKVMWESAVGLLTPITRQNSGRLLRVWLAGVVSMPPLTVAAAVMVVLPSNVSCARSEQGKPGLVAAAAGLGPKPTAMALNTAIRDAMDFKDMSRSSRESPAAGGCPG